MALTLLCGPPVLSVWAEQLPPAATRQFRQAIEHLRAQQHLLAEQLLRQLVHQFPGNADVQEALAMVLDLQGKPEAAAFHFQEAVRLNPRSAQARLNLGANYFRRGLLAAAEDQFQEALKLRPDDPTIHFNLGTLYLTQRSFQDALPYLQQAQQRQPELFQNSYQLALCYFFLREHQQAEKLLDALAPRASGRGEFFLLLGLNHKALGRDRAAQDAFRRAFDHLPAASEVYATLGPMFFQLGLYAEAIPLFEHAAENHPESYEAAYHLARAYQGAGQLERAREAAQKALQKWQTADLHHLLAEVNERLQNYLEAVQHFQRAAELEPSERNLYDLGYEFLLHWSWDAAQAVFRKALELFPKSERLWLGLATAYYAQGDYTQATQTLLQATALAPDNLMAYRLLIAAYPLSRGQTEAVQQQLRKFHQRQPDNAWANYYYALSLCQEPDRRATETELSEATQLLQRAIALKPDLAEAHYHLGVLLTELRQWPQAIPALAAAVRLKPDYVEAHYRLALAYQRVGNSAQAQAMLARYEKMKKEQDAELDRRAAQTTKFIYSLKP